MLVCIRSASGRDYAVECENVRFDRFSSFWVCVDVLMLFDDDGPIWIDGPWVELSFNSSVYSLNF